jgi:putative adhesin Stv-like protein
MPVDQAKVRKHREAKPQSVTLGKELRLWMDESGEPAEHLLISSHGCYVGERDKLGKFTDWRRNLSGLGGWTKVPAWTTLWFYGPHGATLDDPGLKIMNTGKFYEMVFANEPVRNYRLTRYQEGSGKESYDHIVKDIKRNRVYVSMQDAAQGLGPEQMAYIAKKCPFTFPKMDVLTVRKRWWLMLTGVTLHNVLQRLDNKGYRYANIHCSFCRSNAFGGSGSHNVKDNPFSLSDNV